MRPRDLVSLAVYQGHSIPPAYGIVDDISESGARIETDRILAKGQNLQLRIQFASQPHLFEASARVRWTRPAAMLTPNPKNGALSGIELDGISPYEVRRLRQLLVSPDFEISTSGDDQFEEFLDALRPFLKKLGTALGELSRNH